ncbi:MAG: peptide chain release factor N(5)-glutamine methyltransferase [Balneolaceae bacterium]
MSSENRVWTVLSMLEWATDYFQKKDIPDPRHSIEWLLAHVLGVKRLDLYLQFDRPLSEKELGELRPLVKRRASHEPLQYIIGHTDFMACIIHVNPHVLIPRIETEQLVEILLTRTATKKDHPISLLDIGTGSGCIPISIKKENPEWYCAGLDNSDDALTVARENAERNEVDVDFFTGDLFDLSTNKRCTERTWDIIISNPPYIHPDEKSTIKKQVINFEPAGSLFHAQPLDVYKSIIEFSKEKGTHLFLECNDKTAGKVKEIAGHYFENVELLNDLDKNPRFLISE